MDVGPGRNQIFIWEQDMKGKFVLLSLLFLLTLVGCRDGLPPLQDAYELNTSTPRPTETPQPTNTPVIEAAEGIGRAFYRAWEGFDYDGMYSLLSAQSQALVGRDAFVSVYEEAMRTATVQAIHTQPLAAIQEENRAQMQVQVVWETAVVGTISREHQLTLAHSGDRWGVVWDESLILPELAGGQRLHMAYRIPARANIYDRNGDALAYQGTAVTLSVIPGQMEDETGLLEALSPLLRREPEEIQQLYATALPNWRVPLGNVAADVLEAQGEALEPYLDNGLIAEPRLTRLYTQNGVAPHVTGYVGAIPDGALEQYRSQGYRGDEKVGLAGIEAWGEEYLRGTRGGELTIVDQNGEYISTVQQTESRQARSIYLTIDGAFQREVEAALTEAVTTSPGVAGSVVVLDVHTGEVLAMASYPSYDPSIFDATRPEAQEALAAILNDPNNPLVNRAAQGAYPTGSLFKVVTLSAGLNSGYYTADTTYTSTGSWRKLGDNFVKFDWRSGGHGTISYRRALTVSCNTCFYDMGYTLNQADPFFLPEVARQFGLGQPTDIVGIEEAAGLIPDPEWKANNIGESWLEGDAVNMAIGQGYVQVTPLQVAAIFGAIANGGQRYRPTVVDRIGQGGGAPEEEIPLQESGQIPLSPENLSVIKEAMWDVATEDYGTASHRFVDLPVPVAGKTGTAEAPGAANGMPHAWFAGYAPASPYTSPEGTTIEEPEIAVVVMVENAGEGSTVGAPLFRRVVELFYGIEPVAPFPWQ
jgi:penicillin-binding protein 2